jgi:hypothetical protein
MASVIRPRRQVRVESFFGNRTLFSRIEFRGHVGEAHESNPEIFSDGWFDRLTLGSSSI